MKFKHSLSNYKLTTCDMGELIPIGLWEVLPTDIFQGSTSILLRMSPMTAPVMHPVRVRVHHFFVPNRLLWNEQLGDTGDWETFITGGPDGDDASVPPLLQTTADKGDLLDYLGLPQVAGVDINAMPIRAFNLIFNEWYRDQDLVEERQLDDLTVPKIAWERDYFTTGRPFTQKGPSVLLPIGAKAPVYGIGKASEVYVADPVSARETGGRITTYDSRRVVGGGNADDTHYFQEDPDNPGFPNIWTDLSNATGLTINELRRSMAIQRFQEARAAYGSRYTEYLRQSFGARPLDGRLQRPEFIAGGRAQVSISEVLQTGPESDRQDPTLYGVGDMYGHGISAMRSNKFRKQFHEHGYLMTLMSVRPRTLYQQGVDRHWLKRDKEDYFQRELQYIGQQDVKQNEIYADPANTDNDVFAYQDRYREYRETPSKVCGDFKDLLDHWHLGRKFESAPALNESFISCDPSKRIFNVQSEDTLWVAAQHKMVARRPVAKNAIGKIL